eukprot:439172_1
MSAKKKVVKKQAGPSYIFMIIKAIISIKQYHGGASRAAIANHICKNFGKTPGAHFNASLRSAIKKGLASGALKQGDTTQRFRLGDGAKAIVNPPKKKKPKKKK